MENVNQQLKEDWLKALRSGKYKQGKKVLHDPEGKMCCLGVLCDIMDPSQWGDVEHFESRGEGLVGPFSGRVYYGQYFDGDAFAGAQMPSEKILDLVGITDSDARMLAARNDAGTPFPVIADMIERNIYE